MSYEDIFMLWLVDNFFFLVLVVGAIMGAGRGGGEKGGMAGGMDGEGVLGGEVVGGMGKGKLKLSGKRRDGHQV